MNLRDTIHRMTNGEVLNKKKHSQLDDEADQEMIKKLEELENLQKIDKYFGQSTAQKRGDISSSIINLMTS